MHSSRGLGRGHLLFAALLLLLFGTNANGQTGSAPLGPQLVGYGKHTLEDGKVQLATDWDTKGNSDCDIKDDNTKISVSLKQDDSDKGCTVDLVTSDEKDEFEFTAILKPEEEGKTLGDCITAAYQDNTLPFNYGKTNEELEQFEKGPIYNVNAEGCKQECNDKKGMCMDSTSLEILWHKYHDRGQYQAQLHLVGEPDDAWSQSLIIWKHWEIDGMKAAVVDVKVVKNPETGYRGAYEIRKEETPTEIVKSAKLTPICINKDKAVPPPILWPIVDALDKKDGRTPMRLLVFHLLPLAASRLKNPPPAPPKCRLSLEFSKDKYPLLSKEALTVGPEATAETPEGGGLSTWMIIFIIGGAVLLFLFCVFCFVGCFFETRRKEVANNGGQAAFGAAADIGV